MPRVKHIHATCKYCGQDIEHTGARDWRDRGNNRACVPYVDRKTGETVRPKTKHAPVRAKG